MTHLSPEAIFSTSRIEGFGDNFKELDHSLLFMQSWNEIHGDELMLSQDSMIEHDIPKMVEIWNEKK